MEVRFDNKANILNARLLATHDNSPIYATKTNFTFRGRDITLLQDTNPALSSGSVTVGAIHWKDKIIEVNGYRKKVADLKEKKTGFLNKARSWKWSAERREYEIEYTNDEWTATTVKSDGKSKVVGRFAVPYRPHLFTKADPPLLSITRTALVEDEIFLLLVFIYSEAKRQDDTGMVRKGGDIRSDDLIWDSISIPTLSGKLASSQAASTGPNPEQQLSMGPTNTPEV